MSLTDSQQAAYNAIEQGKNIFLTGPGGTGKSYLIEYLKTTLVDKKIAVTALTGCAAILLGCGAKTLHSWAGIGLGKETVEELVKKIRKNTRARKNWKDYDILIIDEVSMMSSDLFDKLENIARMIRRSEAPFGGMQVVLSGDFFQLPPVLSTQFAFEAASWSRVVDLSVELDEVKRQSDPIFKDILNAARRGRLTDEHLAILRTRKGLDWKAEKIRPTLLFSRRADVDRINDANLKALAGPFRTYTPRFTTSKDFPEGLSLKNPEVIISGEILDKNAPYQSELVLAEGAQVMLIYNLDMEEGLVNGSRGIITGFADGDLPVVLFRNNLKRVIARNPWPVPDIPGLFREQIPLTLAYAHTIHKCQGSTLDSALIDIGPKTFEYGQAYVALSRVKSLESLYIWDLDPAALKVNQKVVDFYESIARADSASTSSSDKGMTVTVAAS
jgi:ATP-dependent DNA helicase PIF1